MPTIRRITQHNTAHFARPKFGFAETSYMLGTVPESRK